MRPARSLGPVLVALAMLPAPLAAAGSEDTFTPPAPTETVETCADGLVWDLATETCLPPSESTNDDSAMMNDARALAHAGRFADAGAVLDLLDAGDPWVLTYRGFLARKTGDQEASRDFYLAALRIDPDHLLARSYMGQGMVEAGDLDGARAELTRIRASGGRGTWPEFSLRLALDRGRGFTY